MVAWKVTWANTETVAIYFLLPVMMTTETNQHSHSPTLLHTLSDNQSHSPTLLHTLSDSPTLSDKQLCKGLNKNNEPCHLPATSTGYCRHHHWQETDPAYCDRSTKPPIVVSIAPPVTKLKVQCEGETTRGCQCKRQVDPQQKYCLDHLRQLVTKREIQIPCGAPTKTGTCGRMIPCSSNGCYQHPKAKTKPCLTPLRPLPVTHKPF